MDGVENTLTRQTLGKTPRLEGPTNFVSAFTPLQITSGYRSPLQRQSPRAVKGSYHGTGLDLVLLFTEKLSTPLAITQRAFSEALDSIRPLSISTPGDTPPPGRV